MDILPPATKDLEESNLLLLLEEGKFDTGHTALKNLHSSLSKLSKEEIELLNKRLKLLDYLIRNSLYLKKDFSPYNLIDQEIERNQIYINLKRNQDGFFAELLLKYHIVQSNNLPPEQPKKGFLERLFHL